MRVFVVIVFVALVSWPAVVSRSITDEDSVVSVYTTQPTTAAAGGAGASNRIDVYHQIASNIAERITSPIYRFLGINRTKTENQKPKKTWGQIELFDDLPEDATSAIRPVDNDISRDRDIKDRDVEPLSVEALRKDEKKPEKITLFSSYLPVGNLEANDTINDIPDDDEEPFEFDDDSSPRGENPFYFILEWLGTIWTLLTGAFEAVFSSSGSNSSDSN